MRLHGLIILLSLMLLGCVGNTPLPEDHYYRLSVETPAQRPVTPTDARLVLVEALRAPDVYASRTIAYSAEPGQLSLEHYHYHSWIDPPARLLQQELIRYLQAVKLAAAVVPDAGRAQPDYRIAGDIRRFERRKTAKGWEAVVALELRADTAPGNTQMLIVRSYEQIVPAADATLEATVQAFSTATTTIFQQFVSDLTKTSPL